MNPSMKKDCIAWIHGIISFVMLIVSSHSVFQGHSYLTIKSIFLAQFFSCVAICLGHIRKHTAAARVYVVSLCKTSINSKKLLADTFGKELVPYFWLPSFWSIFGSNHLVSTLYSAQEGQPVNARLYITQDPSLGYSP